MGDLRVCFFSIVVLIIVLCSCSANPTIGNREQTQTYSDKDSEHYHEFLHGDLVSFENDGKSPLSHIFDRFWRYIIFGGVLQGIATTTGLPRIGLVKGGAVKYQDQSSKRPGYHASHVIRVGAIDPALRREHPRLNKALENYIGHTQEMIIQANVYHGLGGEMDRFQSSNLTVLAEIDFTSTFDDNSVPVMKLIKTFGEIIQKFQISWARITFEKEDIPGDPFGEFTLWAVKDGSRHARTFIPERWFAVGKRAYNQVISNEFVNHWNPTTSPMNQPVKKSIKFGIQQPVP